MIYQTETESTVTDNKGFKCVCGYIFEKETTHMLCPNCKRKWIIYRGIK